jgi:hypothetical protein
MKDYCFPQTERYQNGKGRIETVEHKGLTIRDYFAGQVLAGYMVETPEAHIPGANMVARYCYEIADAMLAERG